MGVLRLDPDREVLMLGCTYATVTAFSEDEPGGTVTFTATPGMVADVVVDIDTSVVASVAQRRQRGSAA